MSAAATSGSPVEEHFRTAFDSLKSSKSVRSFHLRFTIDGNEFETVFRIIPEEHHITNGCISIGNSLDSSLSANSPTKGCFTPTLSKETLPAGVTQTDILQVLSTKLKFTARPDKAEVTISDVAKLVNPVTGLKYPSSFSLWRLLRGEPTIYEKYGYTSPVLETMREKIRATSWTDVKAFKIFGRETLEAFAARIYPGLFEEGKPLWLSMKELSYEEANRHSIPHTFMPLGRVTIIDILLYALGFTGGMPGLSVPRDSPRWQSWNARLLLTSFQEVAGAAGGFRRRSRRVRKTRRQRRPRS